MQGIPKIPEIGPIRGAGELERPARPAAAGKAFAEVLEDAVRTVDGLQRDSEAAQAAFARGEPIELHEVMIKVEEAEIAFRAMMEVRNKLLDAYREIMRTGSGG